MDKAYIIIVNFNNYQETIECLESILKSNYQSFQIFLVDNSVNDFSVNQLSDWATNNNYKGIVTRFNNLVEPLVNKPLDFRIISENNFSNSAETFEDRIIIIRAENNGFAAANNIVLRYVLKNADKTSLIWILNNDTVVEKNTLGNLIASYRKNKPDKFIFAAKLKYYDKPYLIQAVAGKYNKWLGKHYHVGDGEQDRGQYDNYDFAGLNYAVGASIFLPKLFIEEAGIMCEDYFLYFEELDWMLSGSKLGFNTMLVPDAVVYHKEGSSIIKLNDGEKDTSLAEYYSITNRVRFIKKWYPLFLVTILPGVFWALTKRILKGKFKLVKKIVASLFCILFSNKPGVLKYESS